MPLLSIIIPTYNRTALLAEAIDSVLVQEFQDYELIVVDDGSSDDSSVILARNLESHPPNKFRVLRQPHGGRGTARNRGINEAQGAYCVFLDSDDLLFPWSLGTIASAISVNDRPSVLLGREIRFGQNEELDAVKCQPPEIAVWPDLYRYAVDHHLGVTGTLIARTDLLKEVGGFVTEAMVGDGADLMLRLGEKPRMARIESPPIYAYRVRADNEADQQRWVRRGVELIRRFRRGTYPGEPARTAELRKLLARDAAYFAMVCIYLGRRKDCLAIYLKALGIQIGGGNFKFLLKLPIIVAMSFVKGRQKRIDSV